MLLLKNLAQVLTLKGRCVPRCGEAMSELGIIENGAILIRGGSIEWVGPSQDLPVLGMGQVSRTIDGLGLDLVALPGFVDSHTHSIFAGTRAAEYELRCQGKSYQEIAAAGGGIRSSVRQFRGATREQIVDTAGRYLRQFLAHGTTTIEAKSGYGLSLAEERKALEAIAALRKQSPLEIVATFLGAHDIPDEHRNDRGEYVRQIVEEMIPIFARDDLASFCDVFCDRGYFSVEEARDVLRAARRAGLGLRIHAEELEHTGAARLAAELGARSADHLEWIDDEDIEALKRSGTVATILPGTAFNLGLSRYPPVKKLIAAGVPVALASDFNPGSCFTPNMQLILSIACSQTGMTPAQAITAATLNGAFSLELSGKLGSLESGKQADIVLMNVRDYREIPYLFGVNHCVVTIKKGILALNRLEES